MASPQSAQAQKFSSAADWLPYYSSISTVKVSLEDRFVSLTVRQSVGAVAAITLVGLIHEKLHAPHLAGLVGIVATVGVGLLGYLANKYFLQIRAIGEIMAFLEEHRLHLSHVEGVKLRLCNSRRLSIFTIGRAPAWCVLSSVLHVLVVLAVSLAVGFKLV